MNSRVVDADRSVAGIVVAVDAPSIADSEPPVDRRRDYRLRKVVDGIARVSDMEPGGKKRAPATSGSPARRRGKSADPRAELREEIRRLENVRPRGTALTAVTRRGPNGWRAVLDGVGYGATGVGETPPKAIAHLVHLLGGGE